MRPRLSGHYRVDGAFSDGERVSQFDQAHAACVFSPNALHLSRGQFGFTGTFSKSLPIASFLHHVVDVIVPGPKKQMFRINTGWIVATMAHIKAFWNGVAGRERVDEMRCVHRLSVHAEAPVIGFRVSASPYPTIVGFLDLGPKTFVWRHSMREAGAYPRAKTLRPVASRSTAVFAGSDNLGLSHVTSSGSLVRGAIGVSSTVAPRSFYPMSSTQ